MANAQSVPLDDVDARGGDVDQQIDEVILEEIDFVDIEKATIGAGEKSGLEGLDPIDERTFEIERADHAVLGCAERHVDHGNRN